MKTEWQRSLRRSVALASLGVLGLQGSLAARQHGGQNPGSPAPAKSILVIVLDDVGTDKLSFYDSGAYPTYADTPRLEALATNGIRFDAFYVNPVCSSSRACFQTGRYAFRTGIGGITNSGTSINVTYTYKLPNSELMIPELLKHGYAPGQSPNYVCGAFGKWHLTYDYVDPAHYTSALGDESQAVDNEYDRFDGTMSNVAMLNNGDDYFHWRNVQHSAGSSPTATLETDWAATITREDAVAWINAQTGPYFAYVAFNPPHAPLQVPPYALLSTPTKNALIALDPAPPTIPPHLGQTGHLLSSNASLAEKQLYYRAMLESVDAEIGNLLDQVQADDSTRFDNTMILVASDNGTPKGVISDPPLDKDHGKESVYQIGVRVPLIVAGPLVPAGGPHVCSGLVGAVDLWRTIGSIAGASPSRAFTALGISPQPTLDGKSFLTLIQNPGGSSNRLYAFSQIFGPNGVPNSTYSCQIGHDRALTDGLNKIVLRQDLKNSPCDQPTQFEPEELYFKPGDPTGDLNEATNLYDPSNPPVALDAELATLHP